jgi:hypothetical protein
LFFFFVYGEGEIGVLFNSGEKERVEGVVSSEVKEGDDDNTEDEEDDDVEGVDGVDFFDERLGKARVHVDCVGGKNSLLSSSSLSSPVCCVRRRLLLVVEIGVFLRIGIVIGARVPHAVVEV